MSNHSTSLRSRAACALLSAGAVVMAAAFGLARAPSNGPTDDISTTPAASFTRSGGVTAAHPSGRDPFKLPPPPARSSGKGGSLRPLNLPPGVRGLLISGLRLEGVVSENAGREMIAVVTNDSDRAYFLRLHEQLYDGAVTQITPQAVFFTERIRDHLGRESTHEVVKRLNPKPGDGQ